MLSERAARALEVLVAIAAATYVLLYLFLALAHLRYPFELEWMEGGVLEHVRRVLSGDKLYVAPSVEFVPFIYTPLYYYAGAALSAVLGLGFVPLRLLSIACSLGCAALVFSFVRREVKNRALAGLAASLFLASYGATLAWMDLARVDSLFLLLSLAAAWLVRFREIWWGRALAGVLVALAFFTKQSALLFAASLGAYLLLCDLRRAAWFLAPAVALIAGGSWLLDHIHDGWFYYYVFWLPQQHPWVQSMFVDFWRYDILPAVGVAGLVALMALTVRRRRRPFYLFFGGGAVAVAWSGRLHFGGFPNTLLPAFAAIAVLAGIGAHELCWMANALPAPRRGAMRLFLAICAAAQLWMLHYDPIKLIPTKRDVRAGEALIETLRAIDGEVWVLGPGYLAPRAGKKSYAHEWAIKDVLNFGGGDPGRDLTRDILRAIRSRRFAAVLTETEYLEKELSSGYHDDGEPIADKRAFFARTGTPTRPRTIWKR